MNNKQKNLRNLKQATFCFENEDHTLGNSLRCLILKKKGVEFAGYTVPHPAIPEVNIRIQTDGESAFEIMEESLSDLASVCDIVTEKFKEALTNYK